MRLILVRHGESVGNSENRLQGQEDYELTPLGRKQAALTASRLLAEGVAEVYTSPLLRALATAEEIAARLGRKALLLPGVSEYHFGELAGNTYAEVRQRFAADPASATVRPQERVYPGEEGREVFFMRVTQAIWGIIDRHPGAKIAVVSHGGPIALFCQSVLGLPYQRAMPFAIDNCSLTQIEVEDEPSGTRPRARLVGLNDTCHLRE
jgi:broad specificity phosphatase PhoE